MWQSIGDLPNLVRSYHSGYSQLTNSDEIESYSRPQSFKFKIREWKLKHSLCLLLTSWFLLASILSHLEKSVEMEERVEFEKNLMQRRAKVIEVLSWISKHLTTDSSEWSKTVLYLLDWHGQLHKTKHFEPTNTIEFVTNLMTASNSHSRFDYPLSTNSRIFLILWSPFAIFLYYFCLWKVSRFVFKVKFGWIASIVCCLILFGIFYGFVQIMNDWRKLIENTYKWMMFLANVRSIDGHLIISLLIHSIFWIFIFTLYRYLNFLRQYYFNKLVYFGTTLFYYNNLTCEDFPAKRIEFILEQFRKRSLLNRIYLLLFFDYKEDVQILKKSISDNIV